MWDKRSRLFRLAWIGLAFWLWACQPKTEPKKLPKVNGVTASQTEVSRYAMIEFQVDLTAAYTNPYDARQVALEAVFTGPDGKVWKVPGFWDAEKKWRLRFTPSVEGRWTYLVSVQDQNGKSPDWKGKFEVLPSDLHGWLQLGNWVDKAYSPHYLVYQDGTPFYGLGQCDAFDIMSYGYDTEKGFTLFKLMQEYGENILVYWPVYSNPFFSIRYDDYSLPDLKVIDLVVQEAQKKEIFLIFTVWDHPELRDLPHPWGSGNWPTNNGFRKLGNVQSFFTDPEAWAWQENLYRYMIARWGYSPSIGLWQTVSEINGTSVGSYLDSWHAMVNQYFIDHDPYRHPTTASMSGDIDWPAGFKVMDVPQVHVYNLKDSPARASRVIAQWTMSMWNTSSKPNFVGEFGVADARQYPELFHYAIWSAMVNGAAIIPLEWNDSGGWGRMTEAMYTHVSYLGKFVSDLPLAHLSPEPLNVKVDDPTIWARGMGGKDWGFVWIQDASLEGKSIDEVRNNLRDREGGMVMVQGITPGNYQVLPYDTWNGSYLTTFDVSCEQAACKIPLPVFRSDLALKFSRK